MATEPEHETELLGQPPHPADVERVAPSRPAEEGVPERDPDATRVEGAQILVDQAKERLEGEGFTDEQLRLWADTYIEEQGTGDVAEFVAWIRAQQEPPG